MKYGFFSGMPKKEASYELISEIWLTYGKLAEWYRPGTMSFASYCFKYAGIETFKRLARNRRLKNKLNEVQLDETKTEVADMRTPVTAVEGNESIVMDDRLRSVVDKMRPEDFMIVRMYVKGMTFDMIADVLDISRQAVIKRLRRYAKEA